MHRASENLNSTLFFPPPSFFLPLLHPPLPPSLRRRRRGRRTLVELVSVFLFHRRRRESLPGNISKPRFRLRLLPSCFGISAGLKVSDLVELLQDCWSYSFGGSFDPSCFNSSAPTTKKTPDGIVWTTWSWDSLDFIRETDHIKTKLQR